MENQIYRINMESGGDLEFYVCGTNELNPYKKTREIGIQLIIEEKQLDASLDLNELEVIFWMIVEDPNLRLVPKF